MENVSRPASRHARYTFHLQELRERLQIFSQMRHNHMNVGEPGHDEVPVREARAPVAVYRNPIVFTPPVLCARRLKLSLGVTFEWNSVMMEMF